jgi:predicted molibdopterin-dependent oxidoreductase YjgC
MSLRITQNVTRPEAVTIHVNGRDMNAYEGESLATALIAADIVRTYCNMGVCFDCLVEIEEAGQTLRVRACLTAVRAGLRVTVPSG